MAEAKELQVTSDVDSGGRDSSRSRSDAELSDIEVQYSSDGGQHRCQWDAAGGWLGEGRDRCGFSTDVRDARRMRRRAGNQG